MQSEKMLMRAILLAPTKSLIGKDSLDMDYETAKSYLKYFDRRTKSLEPGEHLCVSHMALEKLKAAWDAVDLLPCGCGEQAEIIKLGCQRAVACKKGHVFTGWKDSREDAVDSWNKGMGSKQLPDREDR